ncbi:MAG: SlyX family protein [Arenimonas sp.]
MPDDSLELQFDRRFTELEMRFAFQEQALLEMSDALAASRSEAARNHDLLQRAMEDIKQLRNLLHTDSANEPPPPHY